MWPSTVAESEIASIRIPIPSRKSHPLTLQGTETDGEADVIPDGWQLPSSNAATASWWTFSGYSRAGVATSFFLHEPQWLFDCGCIVTRQRPSCIFLTHTHPDHIQALLQVLFSHRPTELNKGTKDDDDDDDKGASMIHVYFPAPSETALRGFLQSYDTLIRDDDSTSAEERNMEAAYRFQLHPVQIGDERVLLNSTRKIQYTVRIVECHHRKVCYGYSLWQRHWVPSAPYHTWTGPELGARIRSGATVPHEWSSPPQPLLCYLGDSTTRVFVGHPELLRQHRILVLECTYCQGSIEDEQENPGQHTYWPVLQRIVEEHPRILFLLQHFSARHRPRDWVECMSEFNRSSGNYNVHALLSTFDTACCGCYLCQSTIDPRSTS
jgi:ribonuclease BN (tRNA processing enzyme)